MQRKVRRPASIRGGPFAEDFVTDAVALCVDTTLPAELEEKAKKTPLQPDQHSSEG